jgi:hypothetical protein
MDNLEKKSRGLTRAEENPSRGAGSISFAGRMAARSHNLNFHDPWPN